MKAIVLILGSTIFSLALTAQPAQTSYKFDFGSGKVAKGYTQVLATTVYSKDAGFGFDFETSATDVLGRGKNALTCDGVTSSKPFYFSVNVPEGNYKITVTLGNDMAKTMTTVKAESRRLMLENIETKPGEFVTKTFIVNVKDAKINETEKVGLKVREVTKLDWDDKLSLEFDLQPTLAAIQIEKVADQITVYLAGNSTVVNQDDEPWAAWGQMIPRFFKPGVAIANHAESGLTLGSFLGSRRLKKVLSVIKPGDYLFVEFGHNDQKEKGPNDGAWKSYTERMKLFIAEAKSKGAIPVVITSTARRNFDSTGKNVNSLGDYPAAARKAAQDEGVALIDLNEMSTRFYEALGVEPSKKALVHYPANTFPGQDKPLADNTHFSPYGAYELAKCIVEGIKNTKLGLTKYLVDAPFFDPSKPDAPAAFSWPQSPKNNVIKPDGN
ncbi:MAG: GDSL-type esterase/lipase family protein [Bacteroidota bacterium]